MNKRRGFTVVEVSAALIVLGIIFSSVLVIFNDATTSISESRIRMEAFEIARDNMERVLTQTSVGEIADYGISEQNPNIEWELRVEPFSDPSGSGTWVKAISSATYPDSNDQPKTLELTCWLGRVSKEIADQMMKDRMRDYNEMGGDFTDANGLNPYGMPGMGTDENGRRLPDRTIRNLTNQE